MKTLIIDNYDSFTFNLYQQFAQLSGIPPLVIPNDQISMGEIRTLKITNIVLSPGPGRPDRKKDFGICQQILLEHELPLLGICLGHQGLAYFYGGKIIHAQRQMHGQLSKITHNNSVLFQGIPQSFSVVRYHSLAVDKRLPPQLEPVAWSPEGELMAIRHKQRPFWGIQFHPESICTQYGRRLIQNFLKFSQDHGSHPSTKYRLSNTLTGRNETREKDSGQSVTIPPTKKPFQYKTLTDLNQPKKKWEVLHKKIDVYVEPEAAFATLYAESQNAFWLDSSLTQTGLARFSFIGNAEGPHSFLVRYRLGKPLYITKHGTSHYSKKGIFEFLNQELKNKSLQTTKLPFDFNCGFVGYFGYELKAECGGSAQYASQLPDAAFIFADRVIAFDHQENAIYLLALCEKDKPKKGLIWFKSLEEQLCTLPPLSSIQTAKPSKPIHFRLSRPYPTYLKDIQICQNAIKEGETYQVCLTNRLLVDNAPSPFETYRILRRVNPAPYSAYLRLNDLEVLSSSPEQFLHIDPNRWVTSKPIKGTRARKAEPRKDEYAKRVFQQNKKERSENLMIVDLLRNDLGKVCEIGTVDVSQLMHVETYATVHQLVSTIKGHLRDGVSAVDCIRSVFPGGSMTGAPKIRTLEIIDRLEGEARGVYSGALGFLALNGSANLNIVIRTIVCSPHSTSIGIGGAITALSDPDLEFEETLLKAKALIQTLTTSSGRHSTDYMRNLFPKKYRPCNPIYHTDSRKV